MNSITLSDDPKPFKLFGKGTIVLNLSKSARISTEIDSGYQKLVVRSAALYSIRRGPNSSVTIKGDANFDALKRSLSPRATVEFKLDKSAFMSLTVEKEKASFRVKITL